MSDDGRDPAQPAPPPDDADGRPERFGSRLLHTVLFAVVFWVIAWVLALVTLAQLGYRLFTQTPNEDLRRFGAALAQYAGQLIRYLTAVEDALPFPFSDWPAPPRPGGS
jgi:hypothetical protein